MKPSVSYLKSALVLHDKLGKGRSTHVRRGSKYKLVVFTLEDGVKVKWERIVKREKVPKLRKAKDPLAKFFNLYR